MIRTEFLYEVQNLKKLYTAQFRPLRDISRLSQNEIDVLLFLANNPQYDTAKDIVEIRNLSKSHVSKSVENLESEGYLQIKKDRADRRWIHLQLTPKANDIVTQAREIQQLFLSEISEGITPEEITILEKTATQIKKNIERMKHHVD